MAPMKSPPRLRVELHPSRIAAVAVACATIATALLAFETLDDTLICVVVTAIVGAVGLRAVRRLSRPPLVLHVGADHCVSMTTRDGRTQDGALHADTSVGAWLTAIVWIPDGARWYEPARSLLILADMLPAEDFRRLRVYLRYGHSASDPDKSDVAAR